MKRSIIFAAALAFVASANANVTVNLYSGVLANAVGMAIPNGALIQLIISSSDNVFSAPTPSSFTGQSVDDVILSSYASNSATTGVAGATLTNVVFSYSGAIGAGDQILLRWFPTLTTSSVLPSIGDLYGQYRTSVSGLDGSTIAWLAPSDGTTQALNFITQSSGGSQPNSAGYATNTVVPEPSSLGMALLGFGGFLMNMRFRRPRVA